VSRQLALNAATCVVTLTILGVIALGVNSSVEGTLKTPTPSPVEKSIDPLARPLAGGLDPGGREAKRCFNRLSGVVSDPWHAPLWEKATGQPVEISMNFTAWSKQSDPRPAFQEAKKRGLIPMVTWEPWEPVPVERGPIEQGRLQPLYSNAAIAAGKLDSYIRFFARAAAEHRDPIFLRFAHEMNGFWYPWSKSPRDYTRAWRHVRRIFREGGARNVLFVWSVNPNLYSRSRRAWLKRIDRYWPGSRYVDWVGSTMINFGGIKNYEVPRFARRISGLRGFRKPVMLTEVNVHFEARVRWLRALRSWLAGAPWVKAMVWSQVSSHAGAQLKVGNMDWQVLRDPVGARLLGAVFKDNHRATSDCSALPGRRPRR
jgi:mannan endo-1,4-beta-mannosidase